MSHLYVATNEDLKRITKSLDLDREDNVFAICGSGDQAFAMLEYANSVLAIDRNPKQVDFAQTRADYLREGRFDKFLFPFVSSDIKRITENRDSREMVRGQRWLIKKRNRYFNREGRLNNIRSRLDNLSFDVGDFTETVQDQTASRIYISNMYDKYNQKNLKQDLNLLVRSLERRGLLFVTRYTSLVREMGIPHPQLRLVKEVSSSVGYRWVYGVYQKVA
jgi:hypothetical protein